MFWVMLLIYVATTVISALLASKNSIRPSPLGDFQFPTAQEGRAIPVIFGTVNLTGGNTVWWGDLHSKPIKAGSIFGIGGSVVGYEYSIGVQYMICQGPVDLLSLQCDNKVLPFTTSGSDPQTLTINAHNFFGGDKGGGGLAGTISFYRGTLTQGSDPYLSSKQTAAPGFPTYSGTGNGFLAFLAPGPTSVNETITMTATGAISSTHMHFSVDGSVSGHLGTVWADSNFVNNKINFLITTGSIQFVTGDKFTVVTTPARVSPNYPKVCYAVLNRFYVGTSTYPKPINFVVRRCPDPFSQGNSVARINVDGSGADANAALAIYDLLTNVDYGLGIPPSNIDATNFQAQAVTLSTEGLGISTIIDTPSSADSIISEILRHIDGFLYVEPSTGLWTLKLARADYTPSTVPVLTVDNVLSLPKFSRAQWWETINQIFVQYLDRNADFQVRTVQAHDLGNINVTGEVRAETMEFKMLTNSGDAALICMRCLRATTYPLSKLTLTVNRIAWKWRVGGVFKFTWTPLGIVSVIYRITRIGWGELLDGKITIECVEDVFGIAQATFQAPPASGWVNPVAPPLAPVFQRLLEIPYALAKAGASVALFLYALCARQDSSSTGFLVYQNFGLGDTQTNENFTFCPVGLLSADYPVTAAQDATGFTIQSAGSDLDQIPASTDALGLAAGTNLALIDDEIVAWQTTTINTDGTITLSNVIHGVLDTVPALHLQGAQVFFFTVAELSLTQPSAYTADLAARAKFLPENNLGTFPLASAVELDFTTRSRYLRPYPPGNLRIGSLAWGVIPSTVTGDLAMSWSARNRLTQTAMVLQNAGDVAGGGEAGQTYKVLIYIAGTLIHTFTGLGESYTYSAAQRGIDDPDFTKPVTIKIYSNANGLDSYFFQTFTTVMSGPSGTLGPGRYEFGATTVGDLTV
jgi:hypothetical protein